MHSPYSNRRGLGISDGATGPAGPAMPPVAHSLILVVDDEPDNLAIMQWFLAEEGFEVRTAPSGAEALRIAQARVPDLAIVDYMMPDMDGITLCQRLRKLPSIQRLPIILHTAAERWRLSPLPELCADRVVAKPSDARDLVKEVRALLNRPC